MYLEFLKLRVYPAAVVMTSMVGSVFSPVYADDMPHEQTFVVTAYYSPLPDQCCYFRGNYESEIEFNGKGIAGADGTGVYPGMIAGPATYSFGTVIELPGVGVGTIHDRGGRIIEWGDDIHRIDLWMGYGEEGLARALAWGARKMKGTVYPVGTEAPRENFHLAQFNADPSALAGLPKTDPLFVMEGLSFGQGGLYGIRIVQTQLKEAGYFHETVNGNFGPATREALRKFQSDFGIAGDGSSVDRTTAAALHSAVSIQRENLPNLAIGLSEGSTGSHVRQAQKLLRYLGHYRGRTDGVYDADFKHAVTGFQMQAGVISGVTETGAGRIGPATRAAILKAWKANVVALKTKATIAKMDVTENVKEDGLPKKYLVSGNTGADVRLLQAFLVRAGYLPAKDITGTFGPRTEAALAAYQVDRKIVLSVSSKGAGVFGPATRLKVAEDAVSQAWKVVRASGTAAL